MEFELINDNKQVNIRKLFEEQQKLVGLMAKEIAEREFELFEFNLFVSASGKNHLDKASRAVKELRKLEKKDEINLSKYEEIAEEF